MEASGCPPACASEVEIVFYITGFGKFQGVRDNPTSIMVVRLSEHIKLNTNMHKAPLNALSIGGVRVLEVSTVEVDAALKEIEDDVRVRSKLRPNSTFVLLHFGVAGGAAAFTLEAYAYNDATFRVPDERGLQLSAQPIASDRPWGAREQTQLPLQWMLNRLQDLGFPVDGSENPGRFLCNWCYYQSLLLAQRLQRDIFAASEEHKVFSLFVHVPTFDVVSLDDHLHLATELVTTICLAIHTKAESIWKWHAGPIATTSDADAAAKSGDVTAAVRLRGAAPASAVSKDLPTPAESTDTANGAASSADSAFASALDELLSFGFDKSICEQALKETRVHCMPDWRTHISTAVEWVIASLEGGLPPAPLPGPATPGLALQSFIASASAFAQERAHKMVIVVRADLEMGKGKAAAQACHGALKAVRKMTSAAEKSVVAQWERYGEPIVVVRCDNLAHLQSLESRAKAAGLPVATVRDAGRTQVDPGTLTVLAIGPALTASIDAITSSLKLL